MVASAPPRSVLDAFGVRAAAALPAPRGRAWVAGDVVLKAVDDEVEAACIAELASKLPQTGFRLARPITAHDGGWVVAGWTASTRLVGEHSTTRWTELFAAASALHDALAPVAMPSFVARRGWVMRSPVDRWRFADRVAWGELPVGDLQHVPFVRPLLAALRPIAVPSQLVHCDLVGNVLFADGVPPAIVDLSLYWRPRGYGVAIAVADALTWAHADRDLIGVLEDIEEWPQVLVRALLFRVISGDISRRENGTPDAPEAYEPLIRFALERAR